jgi:hypothetical protein
MHQHCDLDIRKGCKLLKRWWTWSGSNPIGLLIIRKLLILRMPRRPKIPSLPGRLYDFCTVNFSRKLVFLADRTFYQFLPKHLFELTPILVLVQRKDQTNPRVSAKLLAGTTSTNRRLKPAKAVEFARKDGQAASLDNFRRRRQNHSEQRTF